MLKEPAIRYRVKFFEKDQKEPIEAMVRYVEPSEFPGLVCFRSFVFEKEGDKKIILPHEEALQKRFENTRSIHVPYHNILFIEELEVEPRVTSAKVPYLRDIKAETDDPPS